MYIKIAFIKQHSLSHSLGTILKHHHSANACTYIVHTVNVPFVVQSVDGTHTNHLVFLYSPDAIIAPTKLFVECRVFFYSIRCSLFCSIRPLFFSASMPNWFYWIHELSLSLSLFQMYWMNTRMYTKKVFAIIGLVVEWRKKTRCCRWK